LFEFSRVTLDDGLRRREIDASVTRIPDGAETWNSGTLPERGGHGPAYFRHCRTYDSFCISHEQLGMVGRIVVEPGGAAEGSVPPDGDVPTSQNIADSGSTSFDEFSN